MFFTPRTVPRVDVSANDSYAVGSGFNAESEGCWFAGLESAGVCVFDGGNISYVDPPHSFRPGLRGGKIEQFTTVLIGPPGMGSYIPDNPDSGGGFENCGPCAQSGATGRGTLVQHTELGLAFKERDMVVVKKEARTRRIQSRHREAPLRETHRAAPERRDCACLVSLENSRFSTDQRDVAKILVDTLNEENAGCKFESCKDFHDQII